MTSLKNTILFSLLILTGSKAVSQNTSLKLAFFGNSFYDEATIKTNVQGSMLYTSGDSLKPAMGDIMVGSVKAENVLKTNNLPADLFAAQIPLMVKVKASGKYVLSLDTQNVRNTCLILEDLATGKSLDLMTQPSYSFAISDTTQSPRFLLHFGAQPQTSSLAFTNPAEPNGMCIVKGSSTFSWTCEWANNAGLLQKNDHLFAADTLKGLLPGVYSYTLSRGLCSAVSGSMNVKAGMITGIDRQAIENRYEVLVDPGGNLVTMKFNFEDLQPVEVSVSDLSGKSVLVGGFTPSFNEVKFSLPETSGIYLVSAKSKDGVWLKKVLK